MERCKRTVKLVTRTKRDKRDDKQFNADDDRRFTEDATAAKHPDSQRARLEHWRKNRGLLHRCSHAWIFAGASRPH